MASERPTHRLRVTLRAAVLATALAWLMLACATPLTLVERDDLGPPADVFQRLLDTATGLQGLRMYGSLDVTGDQVVRKGAFVLLIERPDRLRFEALSSNDVTLLLVVADQGRLMVYDRVANSCAVGTWSGSLRLGDLRLEADVGEIAGLVTGRLTTTIADDLKLWWEPATSHRVLEVRRGDRAAFHTLDDHDRVLRTVLRQGDRTLADVAYDAHERLDDAWMPTHSVWDLPTDGTHASIRVKQGTLNRGFTGRAFETECPEGSAQQEIVRAEAP